MTSNIKQQLRKQIKKLKIKRRNDYPGGASVFAYVQLTPRYGVKFYKRRKLCEDAFLRQKASHSIGLAPEAYFIVRKGFKLGYVTRHAETETRAKREDVREIQRTCVSMGWCASDIDTDQNVGYVDGRLVLIDFDDATLT
jgi:hypothetical protein